MIMKRLLQINRISALYNPYSIDMPCGGARSVIVIVLGNEHGDTSSNPRRD